MEYEYTEKLAVWISDEFANSSRTLAGMHRDDPERIPPPAVIAKWRRSFPTFDALMRQAGKVKAETLALEQLEIADSLAPPAVVRNKAQVRQWLAGKLDPDRFGKSQRIEHHGQVTHDHVHRLSDDALMKIAAGGQELEAIDVQPERVAVAHVHEKEAPAPTPTPPRAWDSAAE